MNHTGELYERYQRQIMLKEFGEAGQQKLLQSKIIVIGAGGLGCPVLQYLVAAGIGSVGIVDYDTVTLDNLHRQVLFTVNDIGCSKVEAAASRLQQINPTIIITPYNTKLSPGNTCSIINEYDIVIDGTDNFAARYMISDACVLLNKPLIYGAISQYEGQLAVFNYKAAGNETAINYRDLFPYPPAEDEVLNCAQAGVLGVLPGIIGTMMANETIKLITGIGELLANQLLTYSVLTNQVYQIRLIAKEDTKYLIPQSEAIFSNTDYEWLCSSSARPALGQSLEIDAGYFDKLLTAGDIVVIDVREPTETPVVNEFAFTNIPLNKVMDHLSNIKAGTVVFFCQTGARSLRAAQWLFNTFGTTKKIYSLSGGIVQWKNTKPNNQHESYKAKEYFYAGSYHFALHC